MIIARDVSFAYQNSPVLDGIELAAYPGQLVGLIGPNGSGKTTLLRILYAGLTPCAGAVWIDEQLVSTIGGSVASVEDKIPAG